MTTTAADQLRRILDLMPRIADGEEHSLRDLADREGISLGTLQRDLQAIAMRFNDPGGFVEGVRIYIDDGNVSLFTQHFLRPMRLTAPELLALELGLAMLRAERPAEEHAFLDAALDRLREALAYLPQASDRAPFLEAGATGLHADPAGSGDLEHIARLRRARSRLGRVRVLYQKATAEAPEERVVHPYALAAVRGAWYLVAHCERAGALRIFRVDRMESVEELPGGFTIPPDFSLEAVLGTGEPFLGPAPEVLRVCYSPRIARWIAERYGNGTERPDGSYVVEHRMADHDWAARHVMQYGADAEVLEPAGVRELVMERLARIAGA